MFRECIGEPCKGVTMNERTLGDDVGDGVTRDVRSSLFRPMITRDDLDWSYGWDFPSRAFLPWPDGGVKPNRLAKVLAASRRV
jgi:hypothetical protein